VPAPRLARPPGPARLPGPARTAFPAGPALLAFALVTGCAPIVQHGPVVSDGLSLGLLGGILTREWDSCPFDSGEPDIYCSHHKWSPDPGTIIPLVSVTAGYGWEGTDSTRPSLFIGAQVPAAVLLQATHLDIFVQAPRQSFGTRAGGVGVVASFASIMPYVQYGRQDGNGSGWHTTQGILVAPQGEISWAPGIALTNGRGAPVSLHVKTLTFHLGGSLGTRMAEAEYLSPGRGERLRRRVGVWQLHTGIAVNRGKRRLD
jgi:hypothetical protein